MRFGGKDTKVVIKIQASITATLNISGLGDTASELITFMQTVFKKYVLIWIRAALNERAKDGMGVCCTTTKPKAMPISNTYQK